MLSNRTGESRLGLCSWSLHPKTPEELVSRVRDAGLAAVQLALTPLAERERDWEIGRTVDALRAGGVTVLSGMLATIGEDYSSLDAIRETGGVRRDRHWEANLARAERTADVAHQMGLTLVTFHAGFLPHDTDDPLFGVMISRLKRIGAVFAARGVAVAFETGQESAATLVEVMRELDSPSIGVNFDPANMLLYGMGEPVDALALLTPWVLQVHVKDAVMTDRPGTWGTEMPVGQGSVNWEKFFAHLNTSLPGVDAVIEREAGERRIDDIRGAAGLVRRLRTGVIG